MLYTFSQAQYSDTELAHYFSQLQSDDALLLWQDGVLLPLKYPHLFQHLNASCYSLELDIQARGLNAQYSAYNISIISMQQLVELSEKYYPQFAL